MSKERKVLIVDDDTALIDILSLSFSLIGNIWVDKANCAEEGIRKAEENLPSLIVMDFKMPGMNGWEAARIIKANPKTAHIPIIGYTAWASKEDIQLGIQNGLNEIITKPIDLDEWEIKLQKYLE
ncbi:MAG: hypothetical protein A2Y40_10005 [Candidatus Margulisbacteria bacterium GWF2_35_9]|nr:MAG: hypothetical protein A2Y40_10005 [Candidatus Margulisbacteria bacterium GWF2_35_9]